MLAPEQVEHFHAFGFVAVRRMFDSQEVELLTAALEAALREARGGGDYNGEARESVHNWWRPQPEERNSGQPQAAWVETDRRVLGACVQLLGEGFTGSHNERMNK